MTSLTLVVVEPGSDWPEFICGAARDIVALSLATGEPDGIMLQRACERADRSGAVVQLAVGACNVNTDDESIHRRAFTASRLLTTIASTDRGRLVLTASKSAPASLRMGLLGLATTLRDALKEGSASVQVRIGNGTVWPVAQPVVRPAGRRQGEGALLAPDLRCASLAFFPCDLDTRGSDRPQEGHSHERNGLPS